MSKRGYSLIEVLACIALMVALVPAASKLYTSISRLHAAQTAALDRMFVFEQVERDLRTEVRAASEIVPSFGAYRTEKRTVVLRAGERVVVFTSNEQFQPQRIQFTPQSGGQWEQRITTYPITHWRSSFYVKDGLVAFSARPPHATRPGRIPTAEVHVVAALGIHGGVSR